MTPCQPSGGGKVVVISYDDELAAIPSGSAKGDIRRAGHRARGPSDPVRRSADDASGSADRHREIAVGGPAGPLGELPCGIGHGDRLRKGGEPAFSVKDAERAVIGSSEVK